VCGGKLQGSILEPTLFTVESYSAFDEALARVNDSLYGLQSGLFSRNPGLILRAFEEIEAGTVMVNDVPTFRADQMPYGGMKDSGTGRKGLRYSIEEMTERELLLLNLR